MPQLTLLQLTQEILASMDSEEINSVTDNVEAEQVARIIRQTYWDVFPSLKNKNEFSLFELTASGDGSKPVLMTVPVNVTHIHWIRYNNIKAGETRNKYELVDYMPLEDFIEASLGLNTDESIIASMSHTITGQGTFEFHYYNDRHPSVYTSFDDGTLIFDAHIATLDTTLQQSKTYCYGQIDVEASALADGTTFDIPREQHSLFFNEAKKQAFAELKMVENNIANQRSRRAWIRTINDNSKTPNKTELDKLPDFGRKRR